MALPSFGPWPDYKDRTTFESRIATNFPLIESWGEAVDTLADQVSDDADSASESAATAVYAAGIATAASDIAATLLNFKGEWSSLTGALSHPASVSNDGKNYMLLQDISDVTTIEPGVTGGWESYWQYISPIKELTVSNIGQTSSDKNLDCAQYNYFIVEPTADITLTFINVVPGTAGVIALIGGGDHAVTFAGPTINWITVFGTAPDFAEGALETSFCYLSDATGSALRMKQIINGEV